MLEQLGPVFAVFVLVGLAVAFVISLWRASKRPDHPTKDNGVLAPGDNSWGPDVGSGDTGSGASGGD